MGERSAKAIAEAVAARIPNHVQKLTSKNLDEWLSDNSHLPRAILFTNKGKTSALLRSLAIDFYGRVKVGQIRDKESEAVAKFGVKGFPTLIVKTAEDNIGEMSLTYKGELKKKPMHEFLSKIAQGTDLSTVLKNAEKQQESTKSADGGATSSPSSSSSASEETKPSQAATTQAWEINSLVTPEALDAACLTPKSGTCVLVLLPGQADAKAELPAPAKEALSSLDEITNKHSKRQSKLFPIYSVPVTNSRGETLRDRLGLSANEAGPQLVALNAKRGWWRKYDGEGGFGVAAVDSWVDSVKLGEVSKERLPRGIVAEESEEKEKAHDEL